jgi:hypothetical protein
MHDVQGFAKACGLLFQILAETVVSIVASDTAVRPPCLPLQSADCHPRMHGASSRHYLQSCTYMLGMHSSIEMKFQLLLLIAWNWYWEQGVHTPPASCTVETPVGKKS